MSKIEWTNETWNPLIGCTKTSAGCKNCYAIKTAWIRMHNPKMAERYAGTVEKTEGCQFNWTVKVNQVWDALEKPLKIKKPTMFFVNSMSDLFHPSVDFYFIHRIWEVIAQCPQHTFQILTKQATRMREYMTEWAPNAYGSPYAPLPNVWLGVSVEDQNQVWRIGELLKVPAAVRFLSCEPLLGPVDLSNWIGPEHIDSLCSHCGHFEVSDVNGGYGCKHPDQEEKEGNKGKCYAFSCPLGGRLEPTEPLDVPIYRAFGLAGDEQDFVLPSQPSIHWVICGGESGPHARPMHPDWARSLRDQCHAAEVPFFFKQQGEWLPVDQPWNQDDIKRLAANERWCNLEGGHGFHGQEVWRMRKVGKKAAGRLLDGREWNEFPNPQHIPKRKVREKKIDMINDLRERGYTIREIMIFFGYKSTSAIARYLTPTTSK